MTKNKILIIDDKAAGEDFSTLQILSQLTVEEGSRIDYYENTQLLWVENDKEDITFLKDFSNYSFIFIHDSLNDPLFNDGLKAMTIEKLSKISKVVLFSGSIAESSFPVEAIYDEQISKNASCYEILRRQYFCNFKNFIDSYFVSGQFQIKYLYNPYIKPKKDKAYLLLEVIKTNLEESIQAAVDSDSFNELLSLLGYKNSPDISCRFLKMSDDEFIENLEDSIENN